MPAAPVYSYAITGVSTDTGEPVTLAILYGYNDVTKGGKQIQVVMYSDWVDATELTNALAALIALIP